MTWKAFFEKCVLLSEMIAIEASPSGKAPGFGLGIPRFESLRLRIFIRRCAIKNISAIVLAGGRGERMKSELPKVLHTLNGQPLIEHVIKSLTLANVNEIVVIVGYKGDEVIKCLGDRVDYAWQHEQLGTGHAVMQAEDSFRDFQGAVVVACGDVPLLKPETYRSMCESIEGDNVGAVVLTMVKDNPRGYGRILRDNGNFQRIVEEKDATPSEREISEVNSGTYIFKSTLLFEGLKHIGNNNAQGEYYLPDVLTHILQSGYDVKTTTLADSMEATGVNTREELAKLEEYIKSCEG